MMTLPSWFEEEWEATFRGRFRIRWSPTRNRWQIEQKMARAVVADRPIHSNDDAKIRETEGFELFAELCPGTTTKCDRCAKEMKLQANQFKTARCPHCRKEHKAFFWAIGPSFLEHMRKVDPHTGGIERVFEEVDKKARTQNRSKWNDGRNYREAAGKDSFNYVHEIQSVGWTGMDRFIHRDKGIK